MKYYSSRNRNISVSFGDAVALGLAPDGGLFWPEQIPSCKIPVADLNHLERTERISRLLFPFVEESFSFSKFSQIIEKVFSFPLERVKLDERLSIVELFHGPTLAFKDFGARFLAQTLAELPQAKQRQCVILVATSGDTGSAVAHAFSEIPGIKTVILYPSGKVSPIQELQLTTFEGSIQALEVQGTFDDCQALVKQAFQDTVLTSQFFLSSANSINIARLLPQSVYYMETAMQQSANGNETVFITPSGNLGNLTAGLLGRAILKADWQFVAALNRNNVFQEFLETAMFQPRASVETYSNAMDVGNPSNLERIRTLFPAEGHAAIPVAAHSCNDEETLLAIQELYSKFQYLADPHTAVAYQAYKAASKKIGDKQYHILSTAHPVKFDSVIQKALGITPEVPDRLKDILLRQKKSIVLKPDYHIFKETLLQVVGN